HADARRDLPAIREPARRVDGGDALTELLGRATRLHESRARQHDEESLAAETAEERGLAHRLSKLRRDDPPHFVARGMAVVIVDALEVVDVDDEDRKRLALAPLKHRLEPAEHGAAVRHA